MYFEERGATTLHITFFCLLVTLDIMNEVDTNQGLDLSMGESYSLRGPEVRLFVSGLVTIGLCSQYEESSSFTQLDIPTIKLSIWLSLIGCLNPVILVCL